MAELNDLTTTAATNTGRFPNGMPVEQLNDASRELEAMMGREFKDRTGQIATAGTATAYTVTLNRAITAYAAGLQMRLRAHVANTGAATLNVNAIGAKNLRRQNGDPLVAGDITLHQMLDIQFNTGLDAFVCVGIGDPSAAVGTIPRFTIATLPAVTDQRAIIVTNESGGAVMAFSDGTNWRRVTDRAVCT
jgi:hypothetical protein